LELTYDLLFEEARLFNTENKKIFSEQFIEDLEDRIEEIINKIN